MVLIEGVEHISSVNEPHCLRQLIASAADIWQPTWAGVFAHHALDRWTDPNLPFVDWLVYVSSKLMPDPPKLKSPASVEPCADGTLITVQEEPPDPENAAQQRHVKHVAKKIWESLEMPDGK